MNIYNKIQSNYTDQTLRLINEVSKLSKKLTNTKNRKKFLLECRRKNIFPRFIQNKTKIFDYSLYQQQHKHLSLLDNACIKFMKNFLNLEIKLCIHQAKQQEKNKLEILNRLEDQLVTPDYIILQQYLQEKDFWLSNKTNERLQKKIHTIHGHQQLKEPIFNDDYCINLSKTPIPEEVKKFLGLGNNFAMPLNEIKENDLFSMIVDTDFLLKSDIIPIEHKDAIKSLVTHDYINYFKRDKQLTTNKKLINEFYTTTKKFLKEHPDIYIINSDKGQKTVIIDKNDYERKMRDHLNDPITYTPLTNSKLDLNSILEKKVNDQIEHLHITGQISTMEKHTLQSNDSIPPRIYGAIKTHKQGHPIRPIVSTINCPTYKLSKYLNKIIMNIFSEKFNIKNAFELKDILKDITLDPTDILTSFDVIAFYTNVSQDEAINAVMKRWNKIRNHTKIKKQDFKNLLELCVKDNS